MEEQMLRAMDQEVEQTGLKQLAPLLVALNSADACAKSIEALQAFMVDTSEQVFDLSLHA